MKIVRRWLATMECRLLCSAGLGAVLADDYKYSHGWRLSTQLLAGLVQGMSALGPRGGLHCGTREYLQATLPVSCIEVFMLI